MKDYEKILKEIQQFTIANILIVRNYTDDFRIVDRLVVYKINTVFGNIFVDYKYVCEAPFRGIFEYNGKKMTYNQFFKKLATELKPIKHLKYQAKL